MVEQDVLHLIGRSHALFTADLEKHEPELRAFVGPARFLVIGGAGSVGRAVTKELFRRSPAALHVVDIDENALAELVRDVRSSLGYLTGSFRAFCVDCGTGDFAAFLRAEAPYDYVLYLAALKHVRSEKDPYTLMRMIRVNVLYALRTFDLTVHPGRRKFLAVSTDKATNPINAMGASKRALEYLLAARTPQSAVAKVRLANVAFSNGSLPQAFLERIRKRQPIAAPCDVRRYFITEQEAAQLCLMSLLLGASGETFFVKREAGLRAQSFVEIARRTLALHGLEVYECGSEDEARGSLDELAARGKWPCYFPITDTTGEKIEEEFVAADDDIDRGRFQAIGVIRSRPETRAGDLGAFLARIEELRASGRWSREDILAALRTAVPEFRHHETGKFLDAKL